MQLKHSVLEAALGTSGGTFAGLVGYLRHCQPRLVVTENVRGLCHGGQNVPRLVSCFRQLGYSTYHFRVDPREVGNPQRRLRLYFLHILQQSDARLVSNPSDVLRGLAGRVASTLACPGVDAFLLPAEHSAVAAMLAQLLAFRRRRQGSESHSRPAKRGRWGASGAWQSTLPDREQDVLLTRLQQLSEAGSEQAERMLDLSQALHRTRCELSVT